MCLTMSKRIDDMRWRASFTSCRSWITIVLAKSAVSFESMSKQGRPTPNRYVEMAHLAEELAKVSAETEAKTERWLELAEYA